MSCELCNVYASNLRLDSASLARYKGAWVKDVVLAWTNAKKEASKSY